MMMNRRHLIAGSAAFAAMAATGRLIPSANAAQLNAIGIQLYTVRELFSADPVKTLQTLAKIGYREVEYGGGGYDKMDHAMLRRTTDKLGMRAPSIHAPYESLRDQFDATVQMAKTLGADTVICPYMTDEHRNEAAWTTAVENFNRFAEKLKAQGLGFAYHNHDFEFTIKPGGVSLYDRLLKAREPELVKLEIDLFWAIKAGQDVKALIRRLSGHIYAYHVKDMLADGNMTSVGKGKINFADIFTLNDVAGVKHFYVENDQSPAPYLPDVTTSFQTLRRLRFQPAR